MNLYCDNYATCNKVMMDRGTPWRTNFAAMIRGWYLYRGQSEGGKLLNITLCPTCYGKVPRRLDPNVPLEGQLELDLGGTDEQGATAPPPEAGRDPEGHL